jgi:hypothetical protein
VKLRQSDKKVLVLIWISTNTQIRVFGQQYMSLAMCAYRNLGGDAPAPISGIPAPFPHLHPSNLNQLRAMGAEKILSISDLESAGSKKLPIATRGNEFSPR